MKPTTLALWSRASIALMWSLGLLQMAILWPHLPDRVATHFDLSGQVDGWSSAQSFMVFFVVLETFLAILFLVSVELTLRISSQWFNLPHKDYWLAPERSAETRANLARDLAFIGLSTQLLIFFAVHQCYVVSTGIEASAPAGWQALGLYLVVVLGWVAILCWRYRRIPTVTGR